MLVKRWPAALLLVGLALTACSKSADEPVGDATAHPGSVGRLTFDVDEGAAAETTVTLVAGGTVTATGADGSTFTLTVPPGAVAADTVVRVVPLTNIAGIPTTAPIVAVRLDPDGLEFAAPAQLEISSPSAAPIDEQFLFQGAHDGTGIAAAEVDPRSKAMVMALTHFSIAGEAGVNDSVVDQIMGVTLADQIGELEQRQRNALTTSRRGQLMGADGDDLLDVVDKARLDGEAIIKLAVANFPTRCSTAQDLVKFMTSMERQGQLLGMQNAKIAWWDAAKQAFPICEKEAIRQCKKARDPAVLVRFWLGWSRQQALVNDGGEVDLGSMTEKAIQLCRPQRYVASGGGPGIAISGKVKDISRPFTLTGKGSGFSVTFLYLPSDETGLSGEVTYEGGGGGAVLSGSGSYTVTGDPGGPLTMIVKTSGCADVGTCRDNTDTITLTPTRVAF